MDGQPQIPENNSSGGQKSGHGLAYLRWDTAAKKYECPAKGRRFSTERFFYGTLFNQVLPIFVVEPPKCQSSFPSMAPISSLAIINCAAGPRRSWYSPPLYGHPFQALPSLFLLKRWSHRDRNSRPPLYGALFKPCHHYSCRGTTEIVTQRAPACEEA